MAVTILFWTLIIIAGFAFLLAVQLRWIAGVSLRRALWDKFGGDLNDPAYRTAVVDAASGEAKTDEAKHLIEVYPNPLAHIRTARKACIFAPAALALILVAGRFVFGVI